MADLTDYQKKKFEHVFKTFYDLDGNGVVDWNDFAVDLAKLSSLLNWAEGSDKKKNAEKALQGIWEDLRKFADKNKDGEISKEEWLQMWGVCMKDTANMPAWITNYMQFMFSINDGNGDDVIDVDEYTLLFKNYGMSEDECKASFNKITNNGEFALNLAEYNKLWHEFFTAKDDSARGNSIFGPIR